MKYKIGEIIEKHIIETGESFRRYAIDHDMQDSELTRIRKGHIAASAKKLSLVIDVETLREPIKNELLDMLENDKLSTELIIDVYNLIYGRKKRDK